MRRFVSSFGLALGGFLLALHSASANPPPPQVVIVPPDRNAASMESPIIYLNRCVGGCTIHYSSVDDARNDTSRIPQHGPTADYPMTAYAWGDAEWAQLVACLKEVYSPFAVTLTETRPVNESYTMAVIAGSNIEIGQPQAGGIAPFTSDCTPSNNVISFTFANDYPANNRVETLCAVAAQETAHAFGIDHSFSYIGDVGVSGPDNSACNDPMSYSDKCNRLGGRKYFRNQVANNGRYSITDGNCPGGFQNTHVKLLGVFGAGTPTTAAPSLTVVTPANGATISPGVPVHVMAGAPRGVAKVSLAVNGHVWTTLRGATFGDFGQPATDYALQVPAAVPNGVMDLVVTAEDDLGIKTVAPTVTVTRGAPCTDVSSCLTGQKCDAGKCYWDPPTGELGDPCTYPEFCKTGACNGTGTAKTCTTDCFVSVPDSCPAGFGCTSLGGGDNGLCLPDNGGGGGGCCSVGPSGPAEVLAQGGLALGLLGLVLRRRRRA